MKKPYDNIVIIQADARQWMEDLRTSDLCGNIDCVITDPPYWTLNKWRNVGTTTRLGGHRDADKQDGDKWFETIDQNDLWDFVCALYDVMAKNSHAYIMCDHEVMPIILNWARESDCLNFRYSKPLVWNKIDAGMGYHWRARHEYIVMLEKGRRKLNNLSLSDVLSFKRVQGKNNYPTEKPLALIETLLLNSTNEGETVLDPFCGSGVVGEAAKRNNRNAILVDVSERAVEWTRRRIDSIQPDMFTGGE
jgi:site-specific DNA-methyltransferase (adenine-specific)